MPWGPNMRLLWLTPETPFPADNGHRYVYANRIKGMAALGHEIHLLAFAEDEAELKDISSILASNTATARMFRRRHDAEIGTYRILPRHVLKRKTAEFSEAVEKAARGLSPDAILIDSTNMSHYLPRTGGSWASILNVHNLDYLMLFRSAMVSSSFSRKVSLMMESAKTLAYEIHMYRSRPYDMYAFVSTRELEIVKKYLQRSNVISAPIGVNMRQLPKRRLCGCGNIDSPTIAFVGNLSYSSNIESIEWFASLVFPIILKDFPSARLVIAGKSPAPKVIKLATACPRVELRPNVDDVAEVFREADLSVAPMISGAGIKVKILDALSCGALVVATPLALEGTELRPSIHVLSPDAPGPEEFAKTCVRALVEPSLRDVVSATGRAFVQDMYSWDRLCASYDAALRRIVALHRSQPN